MSSGLFERESADVEVLAVASKRHKVNLTLKSAAWLAEDKFTIECKHCEPRVSFPDLSDLICHTLQTHRRLFRLSCSDCGDSVDNALLCGHNHDDIQLNLSLSEDKRIEQNSSFINGSISDEALPKEKNPVKDDAIVVSKTVRMNWNGKRGVRVRKFVYKNCTLYKCKYCARLFDDLVGCLKHVTTYHEEEFGGKRPREKQVETVEVKCEPEDVVFKSESPEPSTWRDDSENRNDEDLKSESEDELRPLSELAGPKTRRARIQDAFRSDSDDFGVDDRDSDSDAKKTKWDHKNDSDYMPEDEENDPKKSKKKKKKKEPFVCPFCKKIFPLQSRLKVHMFIHTGERPYKCSFCDKAFAGSSALRSHRLTHTGEKPHKCGYCERSFGNISNKVRHERLHTGENPFLCTICGRAFHHQSAYRSHVLAHSGQKIYTRKNRAPTAKKPSDEKSLQDEQDQEKHPCEICGKVMKSKHNLRNHKKIHSGERPYKCNLCPKGFIQKQLLKKHLLDHSGERPFVCEVCGKSFQLKMVLKVHMRRHTGERPYKCDECGRAFTMLGNWKRHCLTHQGIKPYGCPHCDKFFSARQVLVEHINVHTGARPFACPYCPSCFANRSSMIKHRARHERDKKIDLKKDALRHF